MAAAGARTVPVRSNKEGKGERGGALVCFGRFGVLRAGTSRAPRLAECSVFGLWAGSGPESSPQDLAKLSLTAVTQRAQMVGCSGVEPTSVSQCQQRSHFWPSALATTTVRAASPPGFISSWETFSNSRSASRGPRPRSRQHGSRSAKLLHPELCRWFWPAALFPIPAAHARAVRRACSKRLFASDRTAQSRSAASRSDERIHLVCRE